MPEGVRIIDAVRISNAVAMLCGDANTCIGDDIYNALINASQTETSELAARALDILIENADIAKSENLPLCQDTGMAVVFVDIGRDVCISGSIEAAVNSGVRMGYKSANLRCSIVGDPVERVNTGDNTPAVIHYDFTDDEDMARRLRITVAPKGFGSENMSAVCMLTPGAGLQGAEDFIIETVKKAGANPCPPVIVGVGIGGTMEKAALLSKKALLRDAGSKNTDKRWMDVEQRLLTTINELGIGVSGYGGSTTALGVHILTYPVHIAGLPVAVNIGCHATRHKTIVL